MLRGLRVSVGRAVRTRHPPRLPVLPIRQSRWLTRRTPSSLRGGVRKLGRLLKTVAPSTARSDQPLERKLGEAVEVPGIQLVARLCGVALLSLAVLSWVCSLPSCSRFASLAAQGAQKGAMPAWTGLSAGFLHTLAGPDHLAGLAPLTLGQKQAAAVSMGALWGFGHSSGQLLLGVVFLLLKERFQGFVPLLSKWAGTVVGLTLIGIGIMGIYESQQHHDDSDTGHVTSVKGSIARRGLGTYAVGFVYGLQPDALFVVLPALALPTALATLSYVVMFVVGTVCAMAGYTLAIGTASAAATSHRPWLLRHLSTLAASLALGVGLLILLSSLGIPLPLSL